MSSPGTIGAVGAFDVGEIVGRGATAHVRRGWHRASGERVAIKVFDRGRPDLQAFEAELRVQASLVHRDILMVLDGGVTDAPVGPIPEGTPYMVLEWASGGSAVDHPAADWEAVRRLLVTCLSGLGRAHAAGVVHRDVKMANLLRCTAVDRRPGYKLADFGIALTAGSAASRAGTPASMAPEQIEGTSHEIGPWTDMYAVGCLAFRLVTGRAPVVMTNLDAALECHRTGFTIPYAPTMQVPDGLDAWIAHLRQVDPFERPAHASEALEALWALDGSARPPGGGQSSVLPRGLAAAGRRLARLRVGPLHGRGPELDALRSCLNVEPCEARLVWVRGPQGVGRSHLLRRFAVMAQQEGLADVCDLDSGWLQRLLGSPPKRGGEGLLSRRFPEATPLSRKDLGWLWADRPARLPGNALRRVAEARHGRPLLVLVDDAPANVAALAQVAGLLAQAPQRGPGVVVVASAADGVSRGAWKRLPAYTSVFLEPLARRALEAMLVEQLGLSVPEAARAVAGAGGLPREALRAALPDGAAARVVELGTDAVQQRLLGIASVLAAAGPVQVSRWVDHVEALLPDALDALPDLVDILLDAGLAQPVGDALRIEPALLGRDVPAVILDAVVRELPAPGQVRALAQHGRVVQALEVAEAHVADVGSDTDAILLDGLATAAGSLSGAEEVRALALLSRLYITQGDLDSAEAALRQVEAPLGATVQGRLLLAQRRMHIALFAGRFGQVEALFEGHEAERAAHPDAATFSWLLLSLVPQPTVAGMPRVQVALQAEEHACRAGVRPLKVEARRVLAELAHAEGRIASAEAWIQGGRNASRGRFCLPLLGVILAEARFALDTGDRARCRACLDELDALPATTTRPGALGALQRAELAVTEGNWREVGRAADRALRMGRDVEWEMMALAAEAVAAGVCGEARRWDAADRAVDAATLLAQHGRPLPAVRLSLEHLLACAEAHGQHTLAARAMVAGQQHGAD